jgi:hypothetical protein
LNKVIRNISVCGLGLGLIASASACSTIAEPDNLILQYTGGSLDGSKFKECIEPSKKGPGVVNDHNIYLPSSERSWAIRPDGSGDTAQAVEGGTKQDAKGNQGPKVQVYATLRFYLNTNCDDKANSPVVRWWESVGRRKGADVDPEKSPEEQQKDSGWTDMLKSTMVPKMEAAIRNSTPQFTADEVDNNLNGAYDKLAKAISDELGKEYGKPGAWFCGVAFNRSLKVNDPAACPPIDVTVTDGNYADADVAKARADVFAAEQTARAASIQAQSKVDTANKLKEAGAAGLEVQQLQNELAIAQEQTKQAQACASNPNCTVIVGGNGNVNVNSGK